MKQVILSAILSVAVLFTAPALAESETGPYAGIGVMQVIAQNFCDTSDDSGVSVSEFSCDDSDLGFQVFGGARGEHVGFELGLAGAEGFKASGVVNGRSFSGETTFVMLYAAGTGRLHLNDQFSLMGKFGGYYWEQELSALGSTVDDDGFDVLLGAGAEFKPTDGFAVRAEWVRFFGGGDVDLDAPSVNIVATF